MADFLRSNAEQIAADWERFAATLLPEQEFTRSILRDDIIEILQEIAVDMDSVQSDEQQQGKSRGLAQRDESVEVAAERHAMARFKMGMSARQVISEFRALRATVIRLWQQQPAESNPASIDDLIRFNEAVDQSLTEAAVRYGIEIDRSRELLLSVLGHDLRNPLAAIVSLAELQLKPQTAGRYAEFAEQILVSAERMSRMITDLIELARVRLGAGIAIAPSRISVRPLCARALDEMRAIFPSRRFQLHCEDKLAGDWDEARLSQLLSNLLSNAVQYGALDAPITVTARRIGGDVTLAVHNVGTAIPLEFIPQLFDSFVRGIALPRAAGDKSTSLGLGLYIAKEIATAHGGTIGVNSTDTEGTTFVVRLPLAAPGPNST